MYRQGDLLFIRVYGEPEGHRIDSLVVLGSSVTGHEHRLTAGEVYVHEPSWNNNANFYVRVPEGAELVHEEHKSIKLPAGVYKVVRQREVNGYVKD